METRRDGLSTLTLCALLTALATPAPARAGSPPPCGQPAPAFRSAASLPAFARAAWDATVFLETRTWSPGSGHRDVATGSGVILAFDRAAGGLLIATSSHVVPCDASCVIRVLFPKAKNGKRGVASRARRVWHDHRQDLAILRAPAPPGAIFEVARPASGAPRATGVLAIGFPDPALSDGRGAKRGKRYSAGTLVAAPRPFRSGYRAYASSAVEGRLEPEAALLHTAELVPGSSGGPLIDERGRVLGINTGSLIAKEGAGCVRGMTAQGPRCLRLAVALETVQEAAEELERAARRASRPEPR